MANVARMGKVGKLNRAAAFAGLRRAFEADGLDVAGVVLGPVGRDFAQARMEFELPEVGPDELNLLHSTKYVDVRIRPAGRKAVRVIIEGLTELGDE